MEQGPAPKLSAQELSSATGEPVERVRRLRSLKLIGSEGDERFAPEDIERIRLIQFLERQQIGLETIARAEQEEALLASVVEFLFPNGVGRTYSVSGASDEPIHEQDLQMLRGAKVALDAGFPETALLQLTRVYADALARVAEAEVRLFHFYVHEGLKAARLVGRELVDSRNSVREQLLPIVEPLIRYFHRRGMTKAVREDMILHLADGPARPAQSASHARLRLAIVFLDISSYTPIAEVMGDAVAARIVERFSELVREATTRFDGRIVDRVGDAFLLIFPEPRAALTCALDIERRTAAATHARPHQILATAAVRHEVGALSGVRFAAVGKQRLKGLAEELELFELRADDVQVGERIRDPVCGIEMAPTEVGAKLAVKGEELAFCCEKCLRVFLDAPQRYRS